MKIHEIEIEVPRSESNFDKACDYAYKVALIRYGIDDCGHSTKYDDMPRSSSSIVVEFVSYRHTGSMMGSNYIYKFKAWVDVFDEEEE